MKAYVSQISKMDPADRDASRQQLSDFFLGLGVELGLHTPLEPEGRDLMSHRFYIEGLPRVCAFGFDHRFLRSLKEDRFSIPGKYVFDLDVLDTVWEGYPIVQDGRVVRVSPYRTFVFLADGTVHRHDGSVHVSRDPFVYPDWTEAVGVILEMLEGTFGKIHEAAGQLQKNVQQKK